MQAGRDVERVADQLMAVNENAFVHGSTDGSLYGGRPNAEDWAVTAGGAAAAATAGGGGKAAAAADDGLGLDGDEAAEGGSEAGSAHLLEIEVAPAGRLPFQEASLQVLSAADPAPPAVPGGDAEGQPIEGLDLGSLEAYVGVVGASVSKPAVSTPTAAAAGMAAAMLGAAGAGGSALSRMETGFSEMSVEPELVPGGVRGAPAGSSDDGSRRGPTAAVGKDETSAQAAARAAFRRDTAGWWGTGGWSSGQGSASRMWTVQHTCSDFSAFLLACPAHCLPFADDDDDFFSSDEESAPTETDSRQAAAAWHDAAGVEAHPRPMLARCPAGTALPPCLASLPTLHPCPCPCPLPAPQVCCQPEHRQRCWLAALQDRDPLC